MNHNNDKMHNDHHDSHKNDHQGKHQDQKSSGDCQDPKCHDSHCNNPEHKKPCND